VLFTPSGSGLRSSTLTINYTDSASVPKGPVTRDLVGTATQAALLTLWDALGGGCGEGCGPFDYGGVTVGATGEAVFNIGNNGAATATLMGDAGTLSLPFKFKGGTYPGTGGSCGASLASNNNCSIVVVFAPTAATTSNSVVKISYNDGFGNTSEVHRSLVGTGK